MVVQVLLALSTIQIAIVAVLGEGECPDIHGRSIAPGLHYVPGPDTCTLCICENGQPKWCKAVLCSPPQDCKSFRLGNTCCEFICLDDALSKHPDSILDGSQDFGLRLIASAVIIILLLSMLFFTVHRLRQRKLRGHQNRQMNEDQRSLASIGYIGGSLGYLGGVCEETPSQYSNVWKPPGNYFPRGEAPPPYDEAVAQARAEAISINMSGFHRSFPLSAATNMESLIRMESNTQQRNNVTNNTLHQPNNHSNGMSQYFVGGNRPFYLNNVSSNPVQNNSNSRVNNQDLRDRQVIVMGNNPARNFTAQHSITSSSGNNNFISTLKITSSLSGVTNRNTNANRGDHNDYSYPNQRNTNDISHQPRSTLDGTRQHRTIPRVLAALENVPGESSSFPHMKQRALHSKSNRDISTSFHINDDASRNSNSSASRLSCESNPSRLLNNDQNNKKVCSDETRLLLDSNHRLTKENVLRFGTELVHHPLREDPKPLDHIPRSVSEVSKQLTNDILTNRNDTELLSRNNSNVDAVKRQSSGSLGRLVERHPLLQMPADTTPCSCSYDSEPLTMVNDDQDDYHSECENCKSATGSRYYLDESEEGDDMCETMTLHRRPLPEQTEDLHHLPTSLTLPVKTKRNRSQSGTGSRDAWFSSRPGTSSSEDD